MISIQQLTPQTAKGVFTCRQMWSPPTVPANAGIYARCGRCEDCRALRRYRWVLRAAKEQSRHAHTWFLTLTFGPHARRDIQQRASTANDELPSVRRLADASGAYVTRFVKRCRKAGLEPRYLFVCEPHKNGFPHWHGLVHTWPLPYLRENPDFDRNLLASKWQAGFHLIKPVRDDRAVRYVTKYIAKDAANRVRASLRYGADAM